MTISLRHLAFLGVAAACSLASGCATQGLTGALSPTALEEATVNRSTSAQDELRALPAPAQQISVAVYGFEDQTGQFKPTSNAQTLSRAVTQGATSVLVKALQDAGNRSWFQVVERENLSNLLNERNIIREMRQRYLGEDTVNPQALPPLKFAGVLLEGGIIGFDSNLKTGGVGARYLGIGGATEYREDAVTIYLRAVSTKTGEVLSTVTTEQRIASVGLAGNAFRFVAFQELLEIDAGVTTNQPTQLAVQQAIEKAVYALVVDGIDSGLWNFADGAAGARALSEYRRRQDPKSLAQAFAAKPDLAHADTAQRVTPNPEGSDVLGLGGLDVAALIASAEPS